MKNRKKDKRPETSTKNNPTGSRNAVETAIDLAKSNNSKTWEQILRESASRISQWEELSPSEQLDVPSNTNEESDTSKVVTPVHESKNHAS